jgi:hypothetical protein
MLFLKKIKKILKSTHSGITSFDRILSQLLNNSSLIWVNFEDDLKKYLILAQLWIIKSIDEIKFNNYN